MLSNPKLTVITVCLNAANTIERLMQSVLQQSFADYEFIVIDGGSGDGTIECIKKYLGARRVHFVSEKDEGIYDAMNKGLRMASGEWVYFIGSDDVLFHNRVFETVFGNDVESLDVIYGNVKFVHSGDLYDGAFDHEKISQKNICHQALFFRKRIFDELGNFETKYKISADYEFNLRWMGRKLPAKYIAETIAVFNEKGVSGTVWDQTFYEDFDSLLIQNDIICARAFNALKLRHEGVIKSYRFQAGNLLISPFTWAKNKFNSLAR